MGLPETRLNNSSDIYSGRGAHGLAPLGRPYINSNQDKDLHMNHSTLSLICFILTETISENYIIEHCKEKEGKDVTGSI